MAGTNSTKRRSDFKDITGQHFGQWTVLSEAGVRHRRMYWTCRCSCGTVQDICGAKLRSGLARLCKYCRKKTHGLSKSPEYVSWSKMKGRCNSVANNRYHRYGGRGITVCDEWMSSFEQFYADMGPKPSPRHSIERVNNDLGYSKSNCVWATPAEQGRNTHRNRLLSFNGTTMCISGWAHHLGISDATIRARLKRGWTTEKTLTTPPGKQGNRRT